MNTAVLQAFSAELEKIANTSEGGFVPAFTAPFKETANLVRPSTAKNSWKGLWSGSSNEHPLNREFLADELKDANKNLKGGGKYVDDITHDKGLRAAARRGGWLGNFGKYEGPSMWRKGVNTVARHLPGQRTLLVGGTGLGAYSDLQKKDPVTGRERGGAERVLGAAGGVAGSLGASAPRAIRAAAKGGLPAMAGGVLGSMILNTAGSEGGRFLGRKIDAARGFKPTEQPAQVSG